MLISKHCFMYALLCQNSGWYSNRYRGSNSPFGFLKGAISNLTGPFWVKVIETKIFFAFFPTSSMAEIDLKRIKIIFQSLRAKIVWQNYSTHKWIGGSCCQYCCFVQFEWCLFRKQYLIWGGGIHVHWHIQETYIIWWHITFSSIFQNLADHI